MGWIWQPDSLNQPAAADLGIVVVSQIEQDISHVSRLADDVAGQFVVPPELVEGGSRRHKCRIETTESTVVLTRFPLIHFWFEQQHG